MTTVFTELRDLKRRLVRHGVDLDTLPPFALSPEQVYCLKGQLRVDLRDLDDTEIFTVMGLRCVRADRLG